MDHSCREELIRRKLLCLSRASWARLHSQQADQSGATRSRGQALIRPSVGAVGQWVRAVDRQIDRMPVPWDGRYSLSQVHRSEI